jgi:hypothetical protein
MREEEVACLNSWSRPVPPSLMAVVEVGSEKVAVFGGKGSSDRIIGHVGTRSIGSKKIAFVSVENST